MNRKALRGSAALHIPLQAAPINRTVSPGALAATPGVEADLKLIMPRLAATPVSSDWFKNFIGLKRTL
ncbi:MAG: hypothetical protein ACRDSO_03255 [Pseudonocardiaceae bacterium]